MLGEGGGLHKTTNNGFIVCCNVKLWCDGCSTRCHHWGQEIPHLGLLHGVSELYDCLILSHVQDFFSPPTPLFFKNIQQDHSGEVNEWCWADGDVASEASVQLSFSSNEICPGVKIFVSKAPLWLILSYMWQTYIFVQRYKTVLTQTLFEIFCLNI